MAGAHVQTVTAGGANVTSITTGNITTTSGNLFVSTVGGYRGGAHVSHVVTDSKTNSWTGNPSNPQTPNVNTIHYQYYSPNVTGGASHNFTSTAALATYQTIFVSEFSGMATSSVLDKSAGAIGSSTTPSSGVTATRAQADEILVGSLGTADTINAGTMAAGTGFTIPTNGSNTNFSNYVSATEYKIVSAQGTDAATFTISSEPWGVIIGTYKVADAAPADAYPQWKRGFDKPILRF